MPDTPTTPQSRAVGLSGVNKPLFVLTGGFIALFCLLALISLDTLGRR